VTTECKEQQPIRATAIKAARIGNDAVSMAHMRLAMTAQREDTPAMRWGRLVHMAVLEGRKFLALPVWSGGKRVGAAWNEFKAAVGDGEHVTADERDEIAPMMERTERAMAGLPSIVATEVAMHWSDPVYGRAQARIDALCTGGAMVEVKTTGKIDKRRFAAQSYDLGYHLQLGWYDHALRADGKKGGRYVLAIESKTPFTTAVFQVADGLIERGYEEAEKIARQYRACEACGIFPGPYDDCVMPFELPEWADGGDKVDMEGVAE
jgi:hypothetical protein